MALSISFFELLNHMDDLYPDFVKEFSFEYGKTPMSHWMIPFFSLVAYIIIIYAFQYFMNYMYPRENIFENTRPKGFELRIFTYLHNLFLCLLSMCMATGNLIESIRLYIKNDFSLESIFCDPKSITTRGPLNFWTYIFYLSKYYELIDTLLMVAKRRPLSFLHVYHHIVTLALVYVALCDKMSLQWVAVVTNGYIHVLMYYYYSQAAVGVNVSWKKYLTILQIAQFVLDLVVPQIYLYYVYVAEVKCGGSEEVLWLGVAVILSFLLLFLQFYVSTYRNNADRKKI